MEIRASVNKEFEVQRAAGKIGSSLQVKLSIAVTAEDYALLSQMGEDLKFVFLTSSVDLWKSESFSVAALPSDAKKCGRCWHYRDDVGHDAAHPELCGRCTSNLHGAGESRAVA